MLLSNVAVVFCVKATVVICAPVAKSIARTTGIFSHEEVGRIRKQQGWLDISPAVGCDGQNKIGNCIMVTATFGFAVVVPANGCPQGDGQAARLLKSYL